MMSPEDDLISEEEPKMSPSEYLQRIMQQYEDRHGGLTHLVNERIRELENEMDSQEILQFSKEKMKGWAVEERCKKGMIKVAAEKEVEDLMRDDLEKAVDEMSAYIREFDIKQLRIDLGMDPDNGNVGANPNYGHWSPVSSGEAEQIMEQLEAEKENENPNQIMFGDYDWDAYSNDSEAEYEDYDEEEPFYEDDQNDEMQDGIEIEENVREHVILLEYPN